MSLNKKWKILIMGERGMGKSSIVNRFINDDFASSIPTIGTECVFKTVEVNGQKIDLQLWDVGGGGHGKYPALLKMSCRKVVGAIIVCDCTQISTLNDVNYWKDILDENAVMPDNSPIPALLVANKSDLLDQMFSAEQVDQESLDNACFSHRFIDYIYTSAKTGENIEKAFKILCENIQKHEAFSENKFTGWTDDACPKEDNSDTIERISVQSLYDNGSFRLAKFQHCNSKESFYSYKEKKQKCNC